MSFVYLKSTENISLETKIYVLSVCKLRKYWLDKLSQVCYFNRVHDKEYWYKSADILNAVILKWEWWLCLYGA